MLQMRVLFVIILCLVCVDGRTLRQKRQQEPRQSLSCATRELQRSGLTCVCGREVSGVLQCVERWAVIQTIKGQTGTRTRK
jgi:hypothetical protein